MSNVAVIDARAPGKSVTVDMANRFGMEAPAFEQTLRATVFPKEGTKEQFAAFLLVAKHYELNPVTKEIYAFPAKGGGIVPIVSIDGWLKLINSNPQFDGMDCTDILSGDGKLIAMKCTIYRKDRDHPISVTEYLAECQRPTDPWKTMPSRMLRHKATIQCARYAFSLAGIYDEEEGEVIASATLVNPPTPPTPPAAIAPPAPAKAPETAAPVADEPRDPQFIALVDEYRAAAEHAKDGDDLDDCYGQIIAPAHAPQWVFDEVGAIDDRRRGEMEIENESRASRPPR